MKIVSKAISRAYRFNCPSCGTRLEAEPGELIDVGDKTSRFWCPVCESERYISWGHLKRKTFYEGSPK